MTKSVSSMLENERGNKLLVYLSVNNVFHKARNCDKILRELSNFLHHLVGLLLLDVNLAEL